MTKFFAVGRCCRAAQEFMAERQISPAWNVMNFLMRTAPQTRNISLDRDHFVLQSEPMSVYT
jgi:hypothetical protein